VVGQDDLAVTWTPQAGPSVAQRVELHSRTEPTRTRTLVGTETPTKQSVDPGSPQAGELAEESVTATFRDLTPGTTYTVVVFSENSVDATASAQERVTIPESGTEPTNGR